MANCYESPPYQDFGDEFGDMRRQGWRNLRKRLGYPASKEAGIFCLLINDLRKEAETYLETSICSVVVAYPTLGSTAKKSMMDGELKASRARAQMAFGTLATPRPPREMLAAYGGNDLGLCEHYLHFAACKEELVSIPVEKAMAIIYTETSFSAHFSIMHSAYETSPNIRYNEFNNFID